MANRFMTRDEIREEICKPLAVAILKEYEQLKPGESIRFGMFIIQKPKEQ